MTDFAPNSSKDRSGRSQEEARKDQLLNELSRSLDIVHHDNPIRHTFGQTFEAPVTVTANTPGDTAGFVGTSDTPARSDHRHGTDASAWENLTAFSNSWGNFSGYVARLMVVGGIVYLDGAISAGTLGVTAITIPVGRRPSQIQNFIAIGNSTVGCYVSVETNGLLKVQNGTNVWVGLSGLTYPLL